MSKDFQSKIISDILLYLMLSIFILDILFVYSSRTEYIFKSVEYGIKLFTGLFIVIIYLYTLLSKNNNNALASLTFFYLFYICINIYDAIISGTFNITLIINPAYSVLVWTFPLLILVSSAWLDYNKLINIFYWFSPVKTLIILAGAIVLEHYDVTIHYPSIYLVTLISLYLYKEKSKIFYLINFLLLVLLIVLSGNRVYILGLIFLYSMPFIKQRLKLNNANYFALTLAVPFVLYFGLIGGNELYISFIESAGDGSDFFTDTRSFIVDEFFEDLNFKEIIFGKGLNGTYYSPYFFDVSVEQGGDYYIRSGTEIGTLNLVLKFGLIGLINFLLMMWIPMFYKNNKKKYVILFSNISLFLLFIFMIELPFSISFIYFIWFISVGYLYKNNE